ncbi:hypothetical protein BN1012_Phect1512 [Candidatus Phaeomarinobacter ectocarpi]|uniref:Uncharacterized protein n=1 Tax=Candidatus Phaeomarinibacter ectocarpi TaxID=1458461 RepID=X5MN28_9HYPH|nr:hypothetical protein BN1012_Phect1512 [Candidatus Phaeomarinobacter ectocarpi]
MAFSKGHKPLAIIHFLRNNTAPLGWIFIHQGRVAAFARSTSERA